MTGSGTTTGVREGVRSDEELIADEQVQVAPQEGSGLPPIGTEVFGIGNVADSWQMLGLYEVEFTGGRTKQAILIGAVREGVGGTDWLVEEIQSGRLGSEGSNEAYRAIRRLIRECAGAFKSFDSVEEYQAYQVKARGQLEVEELKLLEVLNGIRRRLGKLPLVFDVKEG